MMAVESVPASGQVYMTSWLERLSALARPLAGGNGGGDRTPSDRARIDAELRHAQKLALAGRLATGMVHDFNNALLVAIACLELITEAPANTSVVRDQAKAATDAIGRASELARRLATFGRPDDGTRRPVELNEIVRASTQLFEPLARPFIEVSVCCPAHELTVSADPAQIEHALLNLCLNARDAMPHGGTLHVSTRSAIRWMPKNGDGRGGVPVTYAVVEVSDTGTGIPQDLQGQIFEPFFTTKPDGKGSGLGLAMVRETALAHEGLVELTSDAMGTAVRLLLPLA